MSKYFLSIFLIVSFLIKASSNESMEIPATTQIPIFLKILSFDRKLNERSGGELNMLIVYQGNFLSSQLASEEVNDALIELSIKKVEGIPVRFYYIDLDESDLLEAVIKYKINLIYICPLRGISMGNITSICREKSILSFTGVSSYVESGISVGLELRNDRPQIIINLTAAKAEGADFSSQLLKLSKVIE